MGIAILSGVDLSGAPLTRTNLWGSVFAGVDLSTVTPIPLGVDLRLTTGEMSFGVDVANRAVQAAIVVMPDVALYQTTSIVQPEWRSRPYALSLDAGVLVGRQRLLNAGRLRTSPQRSPNRLDWIMTSILTDSPD